MRKHAGAFVCPPEVHNLSHDFPPRLLHLSAARDTILIRLSGTCSCTCYAPNCRSNPIAHRVRRKRQRLPPSLLIETASDQVLLFGPVSCPEAFPIKASDKPGMILGTDSLLLRIWPDGL